MQPLQPINHFSARQAVVFIAIAVMFIILSPWLLGHYGFALCKAALSVGHLPSCDLLEKPLFSVEVLFLTCVFLLIRVYRVDQVSLKLVCKYPLRKEDFFKRLFDGLGNAALAIGLFGGLGTLLSKIAKDDRQNIHRVFGQFFYGTAEDVIGFCVVMVVYMFCTALLFAAAGRQMLSFEEFSKANCAEANLDAENYRRRCGLRFLFVFLFLTEGFVTTLVFLLNANY